MLFHCLCVPAIALALATLTSSAAQPKFFPDDPIWVDNDKAVDASKVGEVEDTNGYDFVVNTFVEPGEKRDVRAMNVNTVDEVPDSSWFTNRIGRRAMTVDEIVRGPDTLPSVSIDSWVVSAGKSSGVQPGFRMRDPATKQVYQIEFDPPSNPELATGAEMIGTAFYYAMGYHTVEVYLAELDPAKVVIDPNAKVFDPLIGERRAVTPLDLEKVYRRAARQPNGKFRVLASRFAQGTPAGQFPVLRDSSRRSERHRAARASPRAARRACLRRLGESRRLARREQPRFRDRRERPQLREALHVRLRVDHGQRHRVRATASRRQRVHPRMAARLADARDARPVHAAVAAHRLSRRCRRPSGDSRATRSSPLAGSRSTRTPPSQHARGRCVLGGAHRVEIQRSRRSERWSRRPGTAIARATDYITQTLIKRRDKVVCGRGSPA